MFAIDPNGFDQLLQSAATSFAIFGGAMGVLTGWGAAAAMFSGQAPQAIDEAINRGIGHGFVAGVVMAVPTFVLSLLLQ